jgi:hypothetical protein
VKAGNDARDNEQSHSAEQPVGKKSNHSFLSP